MLNFELVSPERLLISRSVEMVVIPGVEGDIGALENHAPLATALRAGTITIFENGAAVERLFVAGGFAELGTTGCTVLAEAAEPLADLSVDQARQLVRDCQDQLEAARDDQERQDSMQALDIANARLAAVESPAYS